MARCRRLIIPFPYCKNETKFADDAPDMKMFGAFAHGTAMEYVCGPGQINSCTTTEVPDTQACLQHTQ